MRMKIIIFALLFPLTVLADNHSASVPAETWNCSLNAGKTIDDVLAISAAVGLGVSPRVLSDAQWIFTPSSGDMSDQGRFVLMTAWENWTEMGNALQGFFGDGEGNQIFADFNEAATCGVSKLLDCAKPL